MSERVVKCTTCGAYTPGVYEAHLKASQRTLAAAMEQIAQLQAQASVDAEHSRGECEGCLDKSCPCNIEAQTFVEWWKLNRERMEASDAFSSPIDYALAAWDAAITWLQAQGER